MAKSTYLIFLGFSVLSLLVQMTSHRQFLIAPVGNETSLAAHVEITNREKAAMCSIVVNEELYLDEFVNYHRALGFEKFFVYDNSDNFEMKQWGKVKGDYVEVIHFPGQSKQMPAYDDCANRTKAAGIFEWVAFFDIDEFLVLKRHGHVSDMLQDHCKSGALAVNWLSFDNNGWNIPTSEPVTRRFLYRFDVGYITNQHVKIIARVSDIVRFRNPHDVVLQEGLVTYDSNGTKVTGPFNEKKPTNVVVLHHYHTKSFKEYVHKRKRGRSDINLKDEEDEAFLSAKKSFLSALSREEQLSDDCKSNRVFDDSAWQFLKHAVPGYAGFDKFSLPSLNLTKSRSCSSIDTGQPSTSPSKGPVKSNKKSKKIKSKTSKKPKIQTIG